MHSHNSFSQYGENDESSMPHYISDASDLQQQTNGAHCGDEFAFSNTYTLTGLNVFEGGETSSFSYEPYSNEARDNTASSDVSVDHFASLLQAAANAGQEAAKAAQEQADQEEQQAREQLQQQIKEHFGNSVEEQSEERAGESIEHENITYTASGTSYQSEDDFVPEAEEQPHGSIASKSRNRRVYRNEDESELDIREHERPASQSSTIPITRKRKRGQNNEVEKFINLDEDERPVSQGSTMAKNTRGKRHQSNAPKPRKDTPPTEEVDALLREDALWGAPEDETEDDLGGYDDEAVAPNTPSVKGAAILFKRPTEKSKNYSRKPTQSVS
jgi:hypothetical protein